MPAFKAKYFEEALLSALNQSSGVGEIIVCDDSSDSGIETIAKKYQNNKRDIPLYYERNIVNIGGGDNFIKAVKMATYPYIKPLFDDDLMNSELVPLCIDILDMHRNISLVSARRNKIDSNGATLNTNEAAFNMNFGRDVCLKGGSVKSFLAKYPINFIGEPSCVMFRKDDFLKIKQPFSINNQPTTGCGDLTLWVKLFSLGDLGYIDKTLASFRLWEGSETGLMIYSKEAVTTNFTGPGILQNFLIQQGYLTENLELEIANLEPVLIFNKLALN
jgi:glycosyltransferase involved in cell wall biosynthesis